MPGDAGFAACNNLQQPGWIEAVPGGYSGIAFIYLEIVMGLTPQQKLEALQRIGLGVLEAVEEAGELGAPGGPLYAAMMSAGASLEQFQSFMRTLTGRGMLTLDGECYHITDAGREFKAKLEAKFGTVPTTSRRATGMAMG